MPVVHSRYREGYRLISKSKISSTSHSQNTQQFNSLQKNFNAWSQYWFEQDLNPVYSKIACSSPFEEFTASVDNKPVMSFKCIQDELIQLVSKTIFLANRNNIHGVIEILLNDLISRAGLFQNGKLSVCSSNKTKTSRNSTNQKSSFKFNYLEVNLLN